MRILHISKYYYPYLGGVENICKYLVDNMSEHQMAVLCFDEGRKDQVDEVDDVKVYRVGTWINVARQALSPTYFMMLRRALREFKPDIIHFHWANPYPAAVLLALIPKQVKLVVHWHMDIIKQKTIYPFIKSIEKKLLKRSDLILVTSPNYRDGSIPLQAFKEKIAIVPNAINERNFILQSPGDDEQIAQIRQKYSGKPIIFFIGRHIQYKGLPHLLKAEQYIKSDCEIVVAGKGPLTDMLKQQTSSKRVHFIGKISDEDLRCYLYASSVFAFPSITKNEAFGVALAEAMFCHLPSVTFTIPGSGVNWVNVNGQTGIEVANGNDKDFAMAIDTLLADRMLYNKFSNAAFERIRDNFLIRNMIDACEKAYQRLQI